MSSMNVENRRTLGSEFAASFRTVATLGVAFGAVSACNLVTPVASCPGDSCEPAAADAGDAQVADASALPSQVGPSNTAPPAGDADAEISDSAPDSDSNDASDAGKAPMPSAALDASDADASPVDSAPAVPCNGLCELELCDVDQGVCLVCAPAAADSGTRAPAFGCSAQTPVCNTETGEARQCVECATNDDCLDPAAAHCDTASNTCTPCSDTVEQLTDAGGTDSGDAGTSNLDCAHFADLNVCHAGTCVECFGDQRQACGAAVCNDLGNPDLDNASAEGRFTCASDALQASADWCQPCVSDAQCQTGQACFLEADGYGACFELKSAEQPQSARIEYPTAARAVSVSGAAGSTGLGVQYFALPGDMTCGLLMNAGYPSPPQNFDTQPIGEYGLGGWCQTDTDCGAAGVDDAVCGENDQCTVACSTDADCGYFNLLPERNPLYVNLNSDGNDIDGICSSETGQCTWDVRFSYAVGGFSIVQNNGTCQCPASPLFCTLEERDCTVACATDQDCAESEFRPTMAQESATCAAEGFCDWGL